MGWNIRKCMLKGCRTLQHDRTWFDDDYDKINPFLCQGCHDIYDFKNPSYELLNDYVVSIYKEGQYSVTNKELAKIKLEWLDD
jgi:hypothetical protein